MGYLGFIATVLAVNGMAVDLNLRNIKIRIATTTISHGITITPGPTDDARLVYGHVAQDTMALDSWRLSLYHTQLYPMGYLGFE
jgi:hypothetical protein